jgi:hypothetical protein
MTVKFSGSTETDRGGEPMTGKAFGLVVFLFMVVYGCAPVDRVIVKRSGVQEETVVLDDSGKLARAGIQTPYDLRSILQPVIQYNNLVLSFDYYNQFAWDEDGIFPDYLHRIYGVDNSPFREGEGTLLVAGIEGHEPELIIQRALVKLDPDGTGWWQVRQSLYGESIFYEVLVSNLQTPMKIRYVHPESGKNHETIPIVAVRVERDLREMTPEHLRSILDQERREDFDQEWSYAFNDPEIIGEEWIEIGAGRFRAVHISDSFTEEMETTVDYWISPDVPGMILKILYSSPATEERYVIELREITQDNQPLIAEKDLVRRDGGAEGGIDSEGSPGSPVEIYIDRVHSGKTAPDSTSYYKITTRRRADINISIYDSRGDAELFYYGADPTYYSWRTSSSGTSMDVQDYFVEGGTALYFTVVNFADTSSASGENYTIMITDDVILSSTGVMMKGQIYTQASERSTGRIYDETLGFDGLNYYKTSIKTGPNLRLTASGISENTDLLWFDSEEGSYSGAYSRREGDSRRVEVTGLAPGTVCYFYVVGERPKIDLENRFRLTVEEF